MPFNIAAIENSDLILVIGSNLINEHPIVHLRVRKAVTKKNAKLFTINPFVTKSGDISTDEVVYKVGTLDALLNGICLLLPRDDDIKAELKSKIEPNNTDEISNLTGVAVDRLQVIAEALSKASRVTIIAGEIVAESPNRERISADNFNLSISCFHKTTKRRKKRDIILWDFNDSCSDLSMVGCFR